MPLKDFQNLELKRSRVKIILKMTTVAIQNVISHIREMIFIAS